MTTNKEKIGWIGMGRMGYAIAQQAASRGAEVVLISGPSALPVPEGVRIVYLKTRTEPHRENLKDDYNRIAQRALEEKKEAALDKWFDDHIKTYFIKIDPEYKSCDVLKKWEGATVSGSH